MLCGWLVLAALLGERLDHRADPNGWRRTGSDLSAALPWRARRPREGAQEPPVETLVETLAETVAS
jgi:hypothetical protein